VASGDLERSCNAGGVAQGYRCYPIADTAPLQIRKQYKPLAISHSAKFGFENFEYYSLDLKAKVYNISKIRKARLQSATELNNHLHHPPDLHTDHLMAQIPYLYQG
jgi:hypothetical protein